MSNEQLAPKEIVRVSGTEIESWGEREIITEMVERVMWLHPAAKEVGRAGVFAACQLALLTGASPVPGHNEIHIWWDKKNQVPIVMLGINFDRRRANEVASGIMYVPGYNPRPMTKEERLLYGITDGDSAAICKGYRIDRFDKYLPNLSAEFNIDVLGKMIASTGHAICQKSEYLKKGRSRQWTAEKRAEADLLRKLVPNLENPERSYRMKQAREGLLQLDQLIPNGDLSDEEAASYRAALFGDDNNDVLIVNGESEPVAEKKKPVHWDEIERPPEAWAFALERNVFETQQEAEQAWMEMRKQIQPKEFSDLLGPWQSLCEAILWKRDNPPSLEEWLASCPSIEELAKRAVEAKFRLNIGDVYTDLMGEFQETLGNWRNVPAEDAWAFLSQPKEKVLPHPWLGQMWEKIVRQRAAESTLTGKITQPQIKKLCVLFGEKYANLDDEERHLVTEYLFDKPSLNDFTKAEASVLIDAMEGAGESLADEMQAVLEQSVPF